MSKDVGRECCDQKHCLYKRPRKYTLRDAYAKHINKIYVYICTIYILAENIVTFVILLKIVQCRHMYTDECGVILLTLQGIILGACMYVYTQAEISMAEKASKYTAYTCVFLIMYVSILDMCLSVCI